MEYDNNKGLGRHLTAVRPAGDGPFAYRTTMGEIIYARPVGEIIVDSDHTQVLQTAQELFADAFIEKGKDAYQLLQRQWELF